MKLKDGFILREIAGCWVVVPVAERVVNFNGLITLSESGALLWEKLSQDSDINSLLASVLEEYDVDETTARVDIEEFLVALSKNNLLA